MGESFSVRIEPAKGVMPPNRIDLEAPTITLTDTKNGREREVFQDPAPGRWREPVGRGEAPRPPAAGDDRGILASHAGGPLGDRERA